MRILVACEESQRVCIAFRNKGHEAYSADLYECSGGHPEWHLQGDVIKVLQEQWDMIIAHPPCTYLTVTGNKWFKDEYKDRFPTRQQDRKEAIRFFMLFANHPCEKVCIENPIGVMSTLWRKPNQVIQPYQYGHPDRKSTCLWLKGLPNLTPTNIVEPEIVRFKSGATMSKHHNDSVKLPKEERTKFRSKTYQGIADAMADQWS